MVVSDFRMEEDLKSAGSLLKAADVLLKVHSLLSKATNQQMVSWTQIVAIRSETNIHSLSILETNCLYLEFLRRQVQVSVSQVRSHENEGKTVIPERCKYVPGWDLCWCDNPALCSSECYPACDTHKLLCNYYVAGQKVPGLRQHVFLMVKQEPKALMRAKSLVGL